MHYRFGEFTLDTEREVLTGPDGPVALRRQTFRLLRTLLEHAPALLRRDELIDQVWGHSALSPNVLPQAISELRQALGDDPQSRRYIETLHRRGYRLACAVERTETDTATAVTQNRTPRTPVRLGSYALAAVLLAAGGIWWLWPDPRPQSSTEVAQTRPRTAVALGVFPHDIDVPGWVAPAALELMTQQLGGDERLLVLRSDGLGLPAGQTNARWQHLMHDLLGAPLAISGQWRTGHGDALRLDLNLLELDSGRLLYGGQFTGTVDTLDALLSQAAGELRQALDLPATPMPSGWRSLSGEQRQRYWEALAALTRGEAADAAQRLEALYADAGQPAWLAPQLARALRLSERRADAITLLQSIADSPVLRQKLGDSLRVRAELARLRHDPAEAAASQRALAALFPDEADLLLELAAADLDNLNSDAARDTVARIETNPLLRGDPRLHLLQARLARLDGDPGRAEALAEAAALSATEHDLPAVAVDAHLALAATFKASGDVRRASEVLATAAQVWGDRLPQHKLFELGLQRAGIQRTLGDMAGAADILAALEQQAGAPGHLAWQGKVELALLHWDRGDFEAAEATLNAIEAEALDTDDPDLTIAFESAWGLINAERDRPTEARHRFQRAIAVARETGRAHQVAGLQVNAGLALARQRRFAEADKLWEASLSIFEQAGDRRGTALCLSNLAISAAVQGLHERGFELNERALTIFRELGMNSQVARTSFNLGLLARRQGKLAEAEALFVEAQENYAAGDNPSFAVAAGAHRANRLIDAGRLDDAGAAIQALAVSLDDAAPARQADLHAAEGRLKKWSGDSQGARHAFETAHHLRSQAEQRVWIAFSQMQLLHLDLLTGTDPAAVRVEAEDLLRTFAEHNEPRARAQALALIAETLIVQNRIEEARLHLREAHAALAEMPDINVEIALSWLDAWAADPAERTLRLQALERRCEELGLASRLAQIRTALGTASPHTPEPGSPPGATGLLPPYVLAALDANG